MTEFTTYCLHIQANLVELGKKCWQKASESPVTWLLRLWDLGVDGIMCMDQEVQK